MERVTGGCQCGRVRYEVGIDNDEAYLCHCRMCQKATGGLAAAFKNVAQAELRWLGAEPDWYRSSPIAERPFCAQCGTPLGFRYPDSPKMDLTLGSFDEPGRFRPTSHFGAESMHEAWLDTSELKRMRSDEYQPLVDRWAKAGAALPL
ncbi:MAG TPA: GFA family protein [Sphingomonas sp.]|nr:GFA family protein [Sphingomonas sp.]